MSFYFSNGNASFPFSVELFFLLSRLALDLTIELHGGCIIEKKELFTLREHMGSSRFYGGVRVARVFSFLRWAFALFSVVLCI